MWERTHDGQLFRILNVMDEYTRECMAVRVGRQWEHEQVQESLAEFCCARGVPVHVRSDNGPEFIVQRLREWLSHLSLKLLFLEPGSQE